LLAESLFEIKRATKAIGVAESEIMTFDYSVPAELYLAKRGGGQRKRLQYRCFPTAAEAIRFAIEDFPPIRTLGAWMQVGRARFDSNEIQRLYDSGDYPLRRRTS
jgi:hypothetical protein